MSEEINFEANSVELIDKDNRIIAKKNVKILPKFIGKILNIIKKKFQDLVDSILQKKLSKETLQV